MSNQKNESIKMLLMEFKNEVEKHFSIEKFSTESSNFTKKGEEMQEEIFNFSFDSGLDVVCYWNESNLDFRFDVYSLFNVMEMLNFEKFLTLFVEKTKHLNVGYSFFFSELSSGDIESAIYALNKSLMESFKDSLLFLESNGNAISFTFSPTVINNIHNFSHLQKLSFDLVENIVPFSSELNDEGVSFVASYFNTNIEIVFLSDNVFEVILNENLSSKKQFEIGEKDFDFITFIKSYLYEEFQN